MRRTALVLVLLFTSAAFHAQPALRSPEEFFGFQMGADRELAGCPEIKKYFEDTAAVSDRVELVDAGATTDGNRLIAAIISAPENMARLDEIRRSILWLADSRTISEADARAVAAA